MSASDDRVTVVLTACGRPDLLKLTLESFLRHNTYPIHEWIISEDSGVPGINDELKERYPSFTWIESKERRGQIRSIDEAYSRVNTPYIFHMEDDWEMYASGAIEDSLAILKSTPKVSAVMCREHDPRVYEMSEEPPYLKCWGGWGHFSMNPGLRRLEDYHTLFNGSYNTVVTFENGDPLKGEFVLNAFYRERGYRLALAPRCEGYLRHIGDGRHIGEELSLPAPLKIGLCMIVKNESHIIHEALNCTLPLVDTFCIVDTGSTDNTIDVIRDYYRRRQIPGHVHQRPWKDFGHNRSEALALCDGQMDYILVIDADDLITFPKGGKKYLVDFLHREAPNNLIIQIRQGDLKYVRSQIFKANDGWKYRGVLHEYPTNDKTGCKTLNLPETWWMESRRLGGRNLTGDKPKRDIAILEKGVADEPDNERYVFYLAQSYRDAGDTVNALKWYKKRFYMDRWIEEKWYSAYQVGSCFKTLGNAPSFEKWMNVAFQLRPSRVEPIYHLSEYFRIRGQHYKAYHYIQLGRHIPVSNDSLFVETYHYKGGLDYEASVVEYYVNPDKRVGLRSTIRYLLQQGLHLQNVLANMQFYVQPMPSTMTPLVLDNPFGFPFRPTAVSMAGGPFANVRFVNYLPPTDGDYRTPDGSQIRTQNAYMNIETGKCIQPMVDDIAYDQLVAGYEDLRVYDCKGSLKFFATADKNKETNHMHMVHGDYNTATGRLENTQIVESPTNALWEKNWLPIPGTDLHIYNWHPLKIGTFNKNTWVSVHEYPTPPLFQLFRGSAPPIRTGDCWMAMVHLVEYSTPRKYYHALVELDGTTYKPHRVSMPFVFRSVSIEYCISMRMTNEKLECVATFMDATPHRITIDPANIEWTSVTV